MKHPPKIFEKEKWMGYLIWKTSKMIKGFEEKLGREKKLTDILWQCE